MNWVVYTVLLTGRVIIMFLLYGSRPEAIVACAAKLRESGGCAGYGAGCCEPMRYDYRKAVMKLALSVDPNEIADTSVVQERTRARTPFAAECTGGACIP